MIYIALMKWCVEVVEMWIKKSQEEINQDSKEEMVFGIIFFSIFIIVVFCLSSLFAIPTKRNPAPSGYTWEEVLEQLPFVVIFSIFLSVLCFFVAKKLKLKEQKTVLCDNCGKVKYDDGKHQCDCGGQFVDIKTMKWVEV